MYYYRNLSPEEQSQAVENRIRKRQPWHSPPHRKVEGKLYYLITAACYEHHHIIGKTPGRMVECECSVLEACSKTQSDVYAWCILPNHYHILVRTESLKSLLKQLGQFHGRSSYQWNNEDDQRGRHCWFNSFDRFIRSDRHFWASLNYIHHNPVHHGYAEKWQDWLWSSAQEFIEQNGRDETLKIWREYPLRDYGQKWDTF